LAGTAVLTGSTGWLGRSCIRALRAIYPKLSFHLYSQTGKHFKLADGATFITQEEERLPSLQLRADLFVPLSFLTQDFFLRYGRKEFEARNQQLIERAVNWMRMNRPLKVILISSGAVENFEVGNKSVESYTSYARLKLLQEHQLEKVAREEEISLAIVRAYSLSGPEMLNPEKYAMGNFIISALKNESIRVTSQIKTYRSYCDAESLFLTAARILEKEKYVRFDSAGPIVEMYELAQCVNEVLKNQTAVITHSSEDHPEDRSEYYSKSNAMFELMDELCIDKLDLREQIKRTAEGLVRFIRPT